MTNTEFSLEFDILWNNIMSNQAPGLDDYEKSVFLTQAQEAIVVQLYSGSSGKAFDVTEDIKRGLASLVKEYRVVLGLYPGSSYFYLGFYDHQVTLPNDLLYIIYEVFRIQYTNRSDVNLMVIPTTHDELFKSLKNPFKMPSNKKVLRVDGVDGDNRTIHLITNSDYGGVYEKHYSIKYIKKPNPIIISDLDKIDKNLSINGVRKETECELDSSIHRLILTQAVQIAKSSWVLAEQ